MKIIHGKPYTEKGSKFFGFIAQVESVAQFKEFMEQIKKQHKKASHYCFAYDIREKTLLDDQIKQKYSNDGEPSGCGNALLRFVKPNSAVIVVRYFGGVLLGSGNLIRAYATAAKNVIKEKT